MARPLRIEYPGAFYHVISRGISREDIFRSERDKEKFLEYLEKISERFSIIIHTYCLMSNHYHLLIETPEPNLSKSIQWLNVSYAINFNRKYKRSGHLFQGRFRAILIDADAYLKQLSRYIHLNPVKANLVSAAGQYRWSSYPAFVGKLTPPMFLETGWLLSNFGNSRRVAQKNYKDFVEKVNIKTLTNPSKHITEGVILGDTDFVNWIKDTFLSERKDDKEIPQLRHLKPKVSLEAIVVQTSKELKCDVEDILKKGRKLNKAREIAIHLARDLSGLSGKELGNYFGGVSGALISIMYNRIANESAKNKKLRNRIVRLRKRIFNI